MFECVEPPSSLTQRRTCSSQGLIRDKGTEKQRESILKLQLPSCPYHLTPTVSVKLFKSG